MQLEHRKRSIRNIHLRSSRNYRAKQQVDNKEQYWQASGNDASHGEVHDGIANRARAQITIPPATRIGVAYLVTFAATATPTPSPGLTYITVAADSSPPLWLCSRTWTCVPFGNGCSISM